LASFGDEIKVLWEKAGDTFRVVPEVVITTFASFGKGIVGLCEGAGFAVPARLVVKVATQASGALLPVEVRSVNGAVNAFVIGRIVDHLILAEHALFFIKVEIFRNITGYAAGIVPVSSSRALADVIGVKLLSAFAFLTCFGSVIPESAFGTYGASVAIKKRVFDGTGDALFELDVINLVFRALFALAISVIVVLGMEALHTSSTVVIMERIVALAYLKCCDILSAISAALALEGGFVVALVESTFNTFLTVEEGFLFGTEYAGLELGVVDFGEGAGKTLFFLKVEVFGEEAGGAEGAGVEGGGFGAETDIF
jgi:hypothetical protein